MSISLTNLIPDPLNLTGWNKTPKEWTKTSFEIAGYGGGKVFELVGTTAAKEITVSTTVGVPLIPSHYYYVRWYGYEEVLNSKFTTGCYWPIAEPYFIEHIPLKEAGYWNMYSAVNNRASFADQNATFRLDFNNNYIAGTFYISAPMLIDLTASFGEGNEPNQEWCDKHIPFFIGEKTLSTFDLGLVDVTPIMTSNTTPAGYVASASSEVTVPRAAWCAFDGISNTYQEEHRWHSAAGLPQWIQMQFPEQRAVTAFSIKNCNDVHNGINAFQLQGSNNGSSWTTLGSYNGVSTLGVRTLYTVTSPALYRYYRIYITSTHHTVGAPSYYCIIDQIHFYTSGCSLQLKSNEVWSDYKEVYTKIDGKWRLVLEADIKLNNKWNI